MGFRLGICGKMGISFFFFKMGIFIISDERTKDPAALGEMQFQTTTYGGLKPEKVIWGTLK